MNNNKAFSVVASALGINLVIGVLYAWSIFKDSIVQSINSNSASGFNWSLNSVNDPYAACCLVFALSMIPAGRVQDIYGPSKSALLGGILGGIGFLLVSFTTNYWLWMLGFGGFIGMGIGFAYASTTPAALKWFAPSKSGLITGVVVSGFALASIYIAPLATYLIAKTGLHNTMLFFAAEFFLLISILSIPLVLPPRNHIPIGFVERRSNDKKQIRSAFVDFEESLNGPIGVLKEAKFWILWILLFIGSGAGLMVIGNIKPLAKLSMGEYAYYAIVILAIGDAAGRVLSGPLSNIFGRRKVLNFAFFIQSILMFTAFQASISGNPAFILFIAIFVGLNYGVNLVLFPSYVKDFWGMKHFGTIYGMLFTSWGLGGFILVKLSEVLINNTGNTKLTFTVAGVLIFIGYLFTFLVDNRIELERMALRNK